MEGKNYLTVNEMDDSDKPREKMIAQGKKALSNTELIAILLRSGVRGTNVIQLAQSILASCGNSLTDLARMEYADLSRIKGMASAKTTSLLAALELGWRMQNEMNNSREHVLNDSRDTFNYIADKLVDLGHEEFWAIYLSNRNKVVGQQRISMGGQTDTTVDIRILFRAAIECKAVRLTVVHNHPSGRLTPSREDRELTYQIQAAGELLQIKLIDHLIVGIAPNGKATYHSFRDSKEL